MKQEVYEWPVGISGNSDFTVENLLDPLYHQNYHNLIDIHLSNKVVLQKSNEPTMVKQWWWDNEKQQKTLNFSLDSLVVIE